MLIMNKKKYYLIISKQNVFIMSLCRINCYIINESSEKDMDRYTIFIVSDLCDMATYVL